MVKRRISQLEPHRTDVQSNKLGSDLRRRGSTHSTGSDSLLELYSVESVASGSEPQTRSAWPAPSLALIPEVASVSQISEPNTSSVLPSSSDPVPSVDTDGRLAPLVELLQDQATKHYYHTNDLKDQIASLNSEMHTMFHQLKVVIGEQPAPDVDVPKFEEALSKSFAALETTIRDLQNKSEDEGTADLRQKLDDIRDEIKSLDVGGRPSTLQNANADPISEAVLEKLETLQMEIKNREGLPGDVMAEITKLQKALDLLPGALSDIEKSHKPATQKLTLVPALDLSEVHAKLDELIQGLKSQLTKEPTTQRIEIPEVRLVVPGYPDSSTLTLSQVQDIMNILVETRDQQATQNDRQADSARYLNELNSVCHPVPFENFSLWALTDYTAYMQWLDKFVKDGTSQLDTVAATLTQLSRDVSPGVDQFGNPTGTLFDGLQMLLAESRARDLTINALQTSVNALFSAINERLPSERMSGTLSEFPVAGLPGLLTGDSHFVATEAVENLFDKQRQSQEQVLRAVAAGASPLFSFSFSSSESRLCPLRPTKLYGTDLSDDIKGERLRFIEAMKEATTINVQSKSAIPISGIQTQKTAD